MDVDMVSVAELLPNQEEEFMADEWAIDDVTGKKLDVEKVNTARREEVELMHFFGFSRNRRGENA